MAISAHFMSEVPSPVFPSVVEAVVFYPQIVDPEGPGARPWKTASSRRAGQWERYQDQWAGNMIIQFFAQTGGICPDYKWKLHSKLLKNKILSGKKAKKQKISWPYIFFNILVSFFRAAGFLSPTGIRRKTPWCRDHQFKLNIKTRH